MITTVLPKNETQLVTAINNAVASAEAERNMCLVDWQIVHYYLQGARRFWIRDWKSGDVRIAYENNQQDLQFRLEKLLQQYVTQQGRFMKIDTAPVGKPKGYGLNSIRNAGITHATLQSMVSGINQHQKKLRFIQTLLKYGTGGLRHYRCTGSDIRSRTSMWVVPPWELLCYPGEVQTLEDQMGLHHKRMVLLDWLKLQKRLSLSKDHGKLMVEEYDYGYSPDQYGMMMTDNGLGGSGTTVTSDIYEHDTQSVSTEEKKRSSTQKWVPLTETWIFGEREDEVVQYVVKAGDHIALNEIYEMEQGNDPVLCPIGIGRYASTGRFYARGFVGPLIGLNDQNEKMLARQFQIVADMDEFGMLILPSSSGINRAQAEKRERRKVLFAEPDPISPDYKPFKIEPYSSGDFPGKMANLGMSIQDQIAMQSEILHGGSPGRVDSAAGLGFLYETGNVGIIPASSEIADAYRTVYRSMLDAARNEIKQKIEENPTIDASLELPLIDDRMLGVVLDPSNGQMTLSDNPLPHPFEVEIDVADRLPINKSQMVSEAKEQLQMGLMTPMEFRILNYRESLGLPIVNRAEWESYRKAVYQKVLVFNDGKTPNPHVPWSPESHNPEVALMVVQQLMNSMEFMFATEPVRVRFEDWKRKLEEQLGRKYPSALPYPEQAAEMSAQPQ